MVLPQKGFHNEADLMNLSANRIDALRKSSNHRLSIKLETPSELSLSTVALVMVRDDQSFKYHRNLPKILKLFVIYGI